MGLDTTKIRLCPVSLYIGTAGQEPTEHLGYISDDGIEFETSIEAMEIKSANVVGKILTLLPEASAKLAGTLLQANLDVMAKFIPGATISGSTITLPTTGLTMQSFSIKAVGLNDAGQVRTIKMLYAEPATSFKQSLGSGKLLDLPFECNSTSAGANIVTIEDTWTPITKTLAEADGVLTLDAGQIVCRVAGFGGAADTLTDIAQSGVADGDRVTLQIADAGDAITITHATGTIELAGEVDFVMDGIDDVLILEYEETGTKWVEVGRSTIG